MIAPGLVARRRILQAFGADAAGRHVDDALKTDPVFGLENQPQIGHDVFDFFAVIKAHAADHSIRYAVVHEGFFDRAALGIGAVQHGVVTVMPMAAVDALAHPPDNCLALGPFAADLQHLHRQAIAGIGPQPLVGALGVFGNDGVGGIENVLG